MNTCIANSITSFAVSCEGRDRKGVSTLRREQELNRFFAEIERRALRIAEIGVRDRDEAMDLVQDAMIRLARKYADKSEAEWTPLFYRILQNGVRDWHRRQMVRKRVMVWFGRGNKDEEEYDVVAAAPDLMLACWCGKALDRESVLERARVRDVPAWANDRIVELPPEIILQPGPACLTDGLDRLEAVIHEEWERAERGPA